MSILFTTSFFDSEEMSTKSLRKSVFLSISSTIDMNGMDKTTTKPMWSMLVLEKAKRVIGIS